MFSFYNHNYRTSSNIEVSAEPQLRNLDLESFQNKLSKDLGSMLKNRKNGKKSNQVIKTDSYKLMYMVVFDIYFKYELCFSSISYSQLLT